ncbi:MAG TPA: hypothetical protein VJ783_08580 [Pirellulales bacterium]|nr:hypothetical protein [Pirellulales bacterium]
MKGVLDEFTGKAFRDEVKIDLNGSVLNTDDMMNKWLNGYEYHHAQQALEVFKAVLPEEWQRGIFINMMIDKVKQVAKIYAFVAWLHRRQKGATFHI